MIRLDAVPPHVIRNTAKGGDVTVVPLSAEGVLAWRMFTTMAAWTSSRKSRIGLVVHVAPGRFRTPIA